MTDLPDILRRLLVLAAAGLLSTPIAIEAQAPNPDVLSVHVGMPREAARAALQKRVPQGILQLEVAGEVFSLADTDPTSPGVVRVYNTIEPNEPAVWMIQRTQSFYAQNPMTKTALMTALHEKYGKETLTSRGGSSLYWIFDQSGRLLATADEGLTACNGNMFVNWVRNGAPPSPNTLEQICARSFFAVTAMLSTRDGQLIESYTIELVNLPYALRAATATGNAKSSEAEKARQDLINKGNRKPTL